MLRWEMEFPNNNNTSSSSGSGSGSGGVGVGVAPFVMKTYQMVNDPSTDHLICWGPANNSFVVVDPLLFSRLLLPSFFKHSNFSSFIRQLNTYGFRKVDPDRWEFASEWFLRGQNHLLKSIGRRKNNNQQTSVQEEEEEEEMEMEIGRMRREQEEMEKEIQGMTKRLETTERRPDQMMDFLCKVVEDPQIMPKMMLERERRSTRKRQISTPAYGDNKRRLVSTETESNSAKTTEEEEASSSLGIDSSSTEVDTNWIEGGALVEFVCDAPPLGLGVQLDPNSPPYPFSLLGGDF